MEKEHRPTEEFTKGLKVAVGATIGALALSFSTHHILAPELPRGHKITAKDLTHHFEREREVLHGHVSYGRTRYAVVSGAAE